MYLSETRSKHWQITIVTMGMIGFELKFRHINNLAENAMPARVISSMNFVVEDTMPACSISSKNILAENTMSARGIVGMNISAEDSMPARDDNLFNLNQLKANNDRPQSTESWIDCDSFLANS